MGSTMRRSGRSAWRRNRPRKLTTEVTKKP
jgi:hypothetical protein